MGNEVAKQHDGRVPLHGRLFAQWMHHAYPHECPYPHKGGTTKPMTPEEWMEKSGADCVAADDEMKHHATDPPTAEGSESQNETMGNVRESNKPLMWSVEEELVVTTTRPPQKTLLWVTIRNVGMLAA